MDLHTEGCGGMLLQLDEAGQLKPVGCCCNLKGNECHWTTFEGLLYTILYCFHKFSNLLWFYLGVEIRIVVLGVATAITLDNLGV